MNKSYYVVLPLPAKNQSATQHVAISVFFIAALSFLSVGISAASDSVSPVSNDEAALTTRLLNGYTAEIMGPPIRSSRGYLRHWHNVDSVACWKIYVSEACSVEVEIDGAVDESCAGSSFKLEIGDKSLEGILSDTSGWEEYQTFSLGTLEVDAGEHTVRLQPTNLPNGVFGNVRAVRLTGAHLEQPSTDEPVDISGPIKMYATARYDGSRLSQQDSLNFIPETSEDATTIVVDVEKRFQTIEGFGGAFTEAAGIVFDSLSPACQREVLQAYFDADLGHGFRLCRTHINSCDFSLGSYAYDEVEGDTELNHFSIDHDREHLIPLIHAAQQEAADDTIKVLASPWSPPAWMKTNGKMTGGGKLKPEYREAWARYYCKYIEEYAKENIDIWGLTVQNEPEATQRWESCLYTAEEERDFVRDHLGPALHNHDLADVRLIVWDHNRDRLFDRSKTVFDDPEAAKYVWGAGFHWYVTDDFNHVQMVNDFYPDKKLLFTEGCLEHGPHIGDWSGGEKYGRSIVNDLNHGAVGWIDWNLLLDINGGPNHVENFCSAPILADVEHDRLIYNNSYYYLGHFARFIRPGAKRILCGNTGEELLSTAFLNTDGSLAVVVLNLQEYPIPFALDLGDRQTEAMSPEHSICTLIIDQDSTSLATARASRIAPVGSSNSIGGGRSSSETAH
ncbi:glycoside hydrolase family 30 beta sandwich domain-containing protein [Bythopirellula goksoeyrii]|nr:glycoside hydrolase family 30 beta sandwich domain-containing protein [Bythopirellula goksoeyrii]